MDSRLRGNDKLQDGPVFFVVPAEAGTHTSNQGWIPACAGMANREAHHVLLHWMFRCYTLNYEMVWLERR